MIDAFVDRVAEFADGEPAMNCQLCKYRTQIVGYEAAAGTPQQGHHHHVRGIGTDRTTSITHRTITHEHD